MLSEEELSVARKLGINETVISNLMSNRQSKIDPKILQRFYLALMISDMIKGESVWNVSELYGCTRGDVQNLLSNAASFASSVYHFVQEYDEFRTFSELLPPFGMKLFMCSHSQLIPLMELPFVARDRARSLYRAGFRSLTDVANATPEDLVSHVENLHRPTARQIIAAAKVLAYDKPAVLDYGEDSFLELAITRMQPLVPLDETFRTENSSNESRLDD